MEIFTQVGGHVTYWKSHLIVPDTVRNDVSVAAVTSDCQLQPVTTPK
jgi:hypothetical protein